MKTFKKMAAQGDLLITRIDKLPDDLAPVKAEDGVYVVAHSETGHNHVVQEDGVEVFATANDNFTLYLVVDRPVDLTHMRSFDRHEPLRIAPGVYRINRQREYTPQGYRRVAD